MKRNNVYGALMILALVLIVSVPRTPGSGPALGQMCPSISA